MLAWLRFTLHSASYFTSTSIRRKKKWGSRIQCGKLDKNWYAPPVLDLPPLIWERQPVYPRAQPSRHSPLCIADCSRPVLLQVCGIENCRLMVPQFFPYTSCNLAHHFHVCSTFSHSLYSSLSLLKPLSFYLFLWTIFLHSPLMSWQYSSGLTSSTRNGNPKLGISISAQ